MRAVSCAENVMRAAHIGHPIAHGFIDRFLQGLLPGMNRHHVRPEHFHAINIERLPFAIHRAHVDDALHSEHGADRGGGDAVLARAGFSDDPRLAHALGEQNLARWRC